MLEITSLKQRLNSSLPKTLSPMEVYDIMYDAAITVKTGNGYKTHFVDYKTTRKNVKWDNFTIPIHDEISVEVTPLNSKHIESIIFNTFTPYTGPVKFSIGCIDDIRPKGDQISKTQFCNCAITSLMRGGCSCGGV